MRFGSINSWVPLLQSSKMGFVWQGEVFSFGGNIYSLLSLSELFLLRRCKSGVLRDKELLMKRFDKLFCFSLEGSSWFFDPQNFCSAPGSFLVSKKFESSEHSQFVLENFLKFKKVPKLSTGLKIKVSGRLNGVPIAKDMVVLKGQVRAQSFNSELRFKQSSVCSKWGILGCKIYIN